MLMTMNIRIFLLGHPQLHLPKAELLLHVLWICPISVTLLNLARLEYCLICIGSSTLITGSGPVWILFWSGLDQSVNRSDQNSNRIAFMIHEGDQVVFPNRFFFLNFCWTIFRLVRKGLILNGLHRTGTIDRGQTRLINLRGQIGWCCKQTDYQKILTGLVNNPNGPC